MSSSHATSSFKFALKNAANAEDVAKFKELLPDLLRMPSKNRNELTQETLLSAINGSSDKIVTLLKNQKVINEHKQKENLLNAEVENLFWEDLAKNQSNPLSEEVFFQEVDILVCISLIETVTPTTEKEKINKRLKNWSSSIGGRTKEKELTIEINGKNDRTRLFMNSSAIFNAAKEIARIMRQGGQSAMHETVYEVLLHFSKPDALESKDQKAEAKQPNKKQLKKKKKRAKEREAIKSLGAKTSTDAQLAECKSDADFLTEIKAIFTKQEQIQKLLNSTTHSGDEKHFHSTLDEVNKTTDKMQEVLSAKPLLSLLSDEKASDPTPFAQFAKEFRASMSSPDDRVKTALLKNLDLHIKQRKKDFEALTLIQANLDQIHLRHETHLSTEVEKADALMLTNLNQWGVSLTPVYKKLNEFYKKITSDLHPLERKFMHTSEDIEFFQEKVGTITQLIDAFNDIYAEFQTIKEQCREWRALSSLCEKFNKRHETLNSLNSFAEKLTHLITEEAVANRYSAVRDELQEEVRKKQQMRKEEKEKINAELLKPTDLEQKEPSQDSSQELKEQKSIATMPLVPAQQETVTASIANSLDQLPRLFFRIKLGYFIHEKTSAALMILQDEKIMDVEKTIQMLLADVTPSRKRDIPNLIGYVFIRFAYDLPRLEINDSESIARINRTLTRLLQITLYAINHDDFDALRIGTIFHRLAKMTNSLSKPSLATKDADVILQLFVKFEQLQSYDSQSIANVIYSLGLLANAGRCPDLSSTSTSEKIISLLKKLVLCPTLNALDIANTIYGLGLLASEEILQPNGLYVKVCPDLTSGSYLILDLLKKFLKLAELNAVKPNEISTVLYGLGELAQAGKWYSFTPISGMVFGLLEKFSQLHIINSREISMSLLGLGKLVATGKCPDIKSIFEIFSDLVKKLLMLNPTQQNLCNAAMGISYCELPLKMIPFNFFKAIEPILKSSSLGVLSQIHAFYAYLLIKGKDIQIEYQNLTQRLTTRDARTSKANLFYLKYLQQELEETNLIIIPEYPESGFHADIAIFSADRTTKLMVIEVNGEHHYNEQGKLLDYDFWRSERLKKCGWQHVIQFKISVEGIDVDMRNHIHNVVLPLLGVIPRKISPPKTHSPAFFPQVRGFAELGHALLPAQVELKHNAAKIYHKG